MKIEVINSKGKSAGRSVELPDEMFGIEPNEHAVYLAVKQYLAHQRQGTSCAKERNAVSGSRKKIKKQKGTGTARFGNITNPLFRGGGRVFGPQPRAYGGKLNKKVKSLARASVFSQKAQNDGLKVIEDLSFDAPKTKDFADMLDAIGCKGQKTLLITSDNNQNIALSARNLQKTEVSPANAVSIYDVINANTVLLSEGAIAQLTGAAKEAEA